VVSAVGGARLVVVPALHRGEEGGELFLDRQRLAWIECARRAFAGAELDRPSGELAAATAARLAGDSGGRALVVVGGPRDDAAAAVLEEALRTVGLAARRFEPSPDEEGEARAAVAGGPRRFALPFLEDAAAVAALAAPLAAALATDPAAPLVLELPFVKGVRPPPAPSPLPPFCGFDAADVRAAFTRLVDRDFPRFSSAWRLDVLRHELGVAPELAIYAGRHLRDRNAECLANVL